MARLISPTCMSIFKIAGSSARRTYPRVARTRHCRGLQRPWVSRRWHISYSSCGELFFSKFPNYLATINNTPVNRKIRVRKKAAPILKLRRRYPGRHISKTGNLRPHTLFGVLTKPLSTSLSYGLLLWRVHHGV